MSEQSQDVIDISIVIPLLNEEDSLPKLHEQLMTELERLERTWEIIYCDDGSTDASMSVLREIAKDHPNIRLISFRRNFGQTAGLAAGFDHARGDVVIPMDADLQNDPADIPRLLAKLDEGYDVVSGWRKDRKDGFFGVVLPSRMGNAVIRKVTGVKLQDFGCTMKAYRREVLQDIQLYGEMHRFIPVWAQSVGARITEIPVKHHPRRYGESKYGVSKALRVILDLITVKFLVGYTTKPLYFFGRMGFMLFVMAGGFWTWTIIKKVAWDQPIFTDPFFTAGLFVALAGLQLLLFGVLSELIMRTYYESQHKPIYTMKETMNIQPGSPERIEPTRH
jgi:glycosyltransferase involved in cell wall biosynthesis